MSDIEQKAVDILDKLEALTTQYTPEVVEAAMGAVSVTAAGNLIWGFVGLACAYAAWWFATNFTEYARKKKDKGGYMSDWEVGIVIGMVGGGVATGFIALFSIEELFSIWNWVAIWNPKLALAHKILGL